VATEGGLLDALRGIADTALRAVQTRVELCANDLEEQGARMARIAAAWLLAAFFATLAVVLGTILLVVIFWDTHRVLVLALATAIYALAALAALMTARSMSAARPKALASTLSELARDRAALRRNERG
jgi:uncharacterized membrane protein YqjE